ncbi:GAF domain-containing protein [Blastococcus aurantiacus]|uniref:GAF domain-containing protein n=1 Tax=Blastococcus aurantiacus TaxID=1550231 RepID=A0A1G7R052_9ACTN|nr:GAF and ANTAR domain-containing protein [Blastococcus aurantiacus]SDG04125.1 GAF domain-containing protein [Blastococcus aurantiacus]
MEDLLRALTQITLADRAAGDVLTEIVQVAEQGIPGADSVSTTLLRGDASYTAAYSGPLALHADELQYERGYGPCMDAGRGGVVLRIDDMSTEQRWPDYTANVLQHGVRSSLSIPLPFQGAVIGALNVYSTKPKTFASTPALDAALLVADTVAVAVGNIHAHARLSEEAKNLRLAMESRAVIEQAKGVIMAQRCVNAEQAFEILREASMRYNRKLRDIAASIVEGVQAG